jgi:chromosome segregation ATPase
VKAEEKDEEVKGEKEELNGKLKELEAEVEVTTQLSKEYTALEKKNFDNKIAAYLKTKKFPELASSFESSADTLNSCKQELLKGVQRLNNAGETIAQCGQEAEEINGQFIVELRRQKEKEGRIEEIKKEKDAVRANIIQLQLRIKQKTQPQ